MHKAEINWQRIAFIGEAMLELANTGTSYQMNVAGDTYNTAVYLRRYLGPETKTTVSYITGLGTDSQSLKIRAALEQEQVDTQSIVQVPGKQAGLYLIETTADGERSFTYWRNDSAARYWLDCEDSERVLADLTTADVIYLSGISVAILSDTARDRLLTFLENNQDKTLIFDNNYRPALWQSEETARQWYDRLLTLTDIALLTVDDDQAIYGQADCRAIINRCQQLGIGEIVLKRGVRDCLIAVRGEQTVSVPATVVDSVVDTTAAGDSFAAGYLAGRAYGQPPEIAAATGHKLASEVIRHRGAIIAHEFMPALPFK